MKAIFTLSFLFWVISSFGQNTFRIAVKSNDPFDEFNLNDLVQMSDGSYVCAGGTYLDNDNTEGMLIAKYNSQGQLLISKNLVPESIDEDVEGVCVIKTSDGGVAVSGNINDTISLLKFDASLNLQWHKQLVSDVEDYSSGARILQTSDGGFLVTGSIEKEADQNNPDVGTVIKVDASGNVVWSKQYFDFSDAENSDKYVYDVVPTKDGNYLLLADSYSYSTDTGDSDSTYLIKINGNGNIIWSKYITTNQEEQDIISIITTSDGNFLLCGSIYDNVTQNNQTYFVSQSALIKVNQDGNVLWSVITDNPYNYDSYLYEVTEDKNGNYVASGELDTVNADFDYSSRPYFLKVSSSGSLIWTKVLSSSSDDEFVFGVTSTSDGGFAVAGGVSDLIIGQDEFDELGALYKFGSDGSICGATSSFGSLINLQASAVAKSVPVTALTTSAYSTTLSAGSAGSGFNLCSVFPLQLLSFNAVLQNKAVALTWKTANEVNTGSFTVERSSNGISFAALETVNAKGNGSSVQTYSASDLQPLFGTSYYRLKQVDKDGSFTYSNIVPVTVTANGIVVISPNPVHNDIRVLMQSAVASKITISVTDITGKILLTQTSYASAGTNTLLIPAAALTKGLYVLKITGGNTTQSVRFIKE